VVAPEGRQITNPHRAEILLSILPAVYIEGRAIEFDGPHTSGLTHSAPLGSPCWKRRH
jgi:hypothetical protein